MLFSTTLKKWKSILSPTKPSAQPSTHPNPPSKQTQSEEYLVSLQLPLPRYNSSGQSSSEDALYRPTSQIVCHSPLDKRNKPAKGKDKKSRRSRDDQGERGVGRRGHGDGNGNGMRYTTSTRVLFSSAQFDKVDVRKPV